MARQWFYREPDGSECGPFSGVEVRELVKLGRIYRDTFVYFDGGHGWVRADRIKDLFKDAGSGQGARSAATPPPTIESNRTTTLFQARMEGLATGAEWDEISDFLAAQSSQPRATRPASPKSGSSPDRDFMHEDETVLENLDLAQMKADDRFRQGKAFFFRVLADPRDAFGEAISPGMLAYAIVMISATAVLYVLMWLPFLYGIEAGKERMGDTIRQISRAAPKFPGNGLMPGMPRNAPFFPPVRETVPLEQSPGILSRVLSQLCEVGPNLLLAAIVSLGAAGFLGIFASAVLAPVRQLQPICRGVLALGFSLTPLVCLLCLSLLLGFVATEVALFFACLGVFISALFYHEALQLIGGVPMNRAVYYTPLLLMTSAYLLVRCSAGSGASLLMRGLLF